MKLYISIYIYICKMKKEVKGRANLSHWPYLVSDLTDGYKRDDGGIKLAGEQTWAQYQKHSSTLIEQPLAKTCPLDDIVSKECSSKVSFS